MKGVIIVGIIITLFLVPCVMAHSYYTEGECCQALFEDGGVNPNSPDPWCNCGHWSHSGRDVGCPTTNCIFTYVYIPCNTTEEIYLPDFLTNPPEEIHDGKDNDCDGVIDDTDSDGIDDDGDGHIDEDVGTSLARFLFLAAGWSGSDADFENDANEAYADLMQNLTLNTCQGRINKTIIKPSEINLASTCSLQSWYTEAKQKISAKGLKIEDFNDIFVISDNALCGAPGLETTVQGQPVMYINNADIGLTFQHEFGHSYGLTEEYCHVNWGWPTSATCNGPNSINALSSVYGCNPVKGDGECCREITQDGVTRTFCYGNVNPAGGRCTMGPGGLGGVYLPRGYCTLCYNQITNPPNPVSLEYPHRPVPMDCDFVNPLGLRNTLVTFCTVSDSGEIKIDYMETLPGRATLGGLGTTGQYSLVIRKDGVPILANFFDICGQCMQTTGDGDGSSSIIGFKGIIPDDVTTQNKLNLLLLKDWVPIGQTTLNGASPVANAGPDQCVGSTTPEGTMVTLNASASSDPDGDTLIYTWSAPGVTFADPTAVKPEAFFPIGSTVVTLSVSDGSGSPEQTDTVTITVSETPSISTQPQSQTKVYGESVTFSVVAAGTPPFSYQWKKGGVAITGAMGSSYTIPSLKLSDAGSYSVNVTHECGYRNSNAATLTVNKANTGTTVSSSKNPSVFGQLAPTFTATVAAVAPGAGTPTGTVTFKDGTKTLGPGTLSGGSWTFTPSTTALALGAHSITAVYAGDTNFIGSTSPVLTQTVNPPPKITAYVPNNGKRGATAFKFVISGSAFQNGATVSLTKSGVPAIDATGVTVSSQKNSITCTLKIPSSAPTGSRSVLVKNPDEGTSTVSGFTVK